MGALVVFLAAVGACTIVAGLTIAGVGIRQASTDRQVNARMARASEAQLDAEIRLRFAEIVAHEWPGVDR